MNRTACVFATIVSFMASSAYAAESFVDRFTKECEELGEVKYCACVIEELDKEVYLDSYDDWTEEEIAEDEDINKASEKCFHLFAIDG